MCVAVLMGRSTCIARLSFPYRLLAGKPNNTKTIHVRTSLDEQ